MVDANREAGVVEVRADRKAETFDHSEEAIGMVIGVDGREIVGAHVEVKRGAGRHCRRRNRGFVHVGNYCKPSAKILFAVRWGTQVGQLHGSAKGIEYGVVA